MPLVFVGYDAFENLRLVRGGGWVRHYRWPVYFFVAVAFWNLVGAGLFGFMINPPSALYHMQGLTTTLVHGHAALFGVYGMLGLGPMLFCLRALRPGAEWREGPVRFAFWAINGGLFAMVAISVLPVGLMQPWAAVNHGYWYARGAEFRQTPTGQALRWLRVVGGTAVALGAVALVLFVAGLGTGHALRGRGRPVAPPGLPGGRPALGPGGAE
ncbi:MAG TPA: cbb3-type cytochrome c oxidase subunit I [Polyangiaceae bacterium]|nr:cbb3-type cytochrome c oxidase subunit I [Polyangiaceae bacterium]